MKKTVSVGNSDCSFITENLKILKYFLLKVLCWDKCKILSSLFAEINYTIRKIAILMSGANFQVPFELKVAKSDV